MPDAPAPPASPPVRCRDSLLLLATLAALLFLPGAAARDLWAPDEPRFAQVAREMFRSGDWWVLRDNNRIYTDKPPLLFWLISLASLPFGEVGALSARLPAVACGVGTVCLTAALGRLWFGRFRGFAAGLLLATSYQGFVSSQWVQTDGPLAFFTTLAVLGIARALERERASAGDLALVYGGVAGALLCKGPVGAVVPALTAAAWAVSERNTALLGRLRPWLLGVAAAPVLAWGLLAGRASAGAYSLVEALRHHVLERFAQGLHHPRHSLYFLVSFPLEFLPWTLFLLGWILPPGPASYAARSGRRRALLWLALPFLFFTLSAEKRSIYLLPVFPAAALLVAGAWPVGDWPRPGERGRGRALLPFAGLALLALASVAVPVLAHRRLGSGWLGLSLASAAALACSGLALRAARRAQARPALWLSTGCSAALLLGIALAAAPALNPLKSARPFCERVVRRLQEGERLGIYGLYRSAYVFYTGRYLDEVASAGELERYLERGGGYCILEREAYDSLPASVRGRYPLLEEAAVGHRRMVLIGSPAAQPGSRDQRSATTPPSASTIRYSRLRSSLRHDQGRRSAPA